MYLIDANILLEVLYKRSRWKECYEFLNKIKAGKIKAYILHFTLHVISAILGKPEIVAKFLSEILSWRGLYVIDLNLDFDDALQYYYANKTGIKIISFDKDFDKTNIQRIEPKDI